MPHFRRYLTHYRLLLPGARDHPALWASTMKGALGPEAIYDMVCRRTKAAFGVAVSPHLFRHCAATTIARDAPELIAVASGLLTHANLHTTINYYTPANTVMAARRYADVLEQLHARLGSATTMTAPKRPSRRSGHG